MNNFLHVLSTEIEQEDLGMLPRITGFDQGWWHLLPSSLLHWRPLLHNSGGHLLYVFFCITYGPQSFKLGNGLP